MFHRPRYYNTDEEIFICLFTCHGYQAHSTKFIRGETNKLFIRPYEAIQQKLFIQ